jgi:hypothetical protein
MDIVQLLKQFHINPAGPGQRHYRKGWVNLPCPFCSGHPGNHLGFCVDPKSRFFNRFVCHRCGGKGTFRALKAILRIEDDWRVSELIQRFGGTTGEWRPQQKPAKRIIREIRLPPNSKKLTSVAGAASYLKSRGFDPEEIEEVWGVVATGPNSKVGRVDYSFRLIIPVTLGGKVVTYQSRDWTGKCDPKRKYLACLPEFESVPIKDTLYGLDQSDGMGMVRLMEGVTDVWRWGPGALGIFGMKVTQNQILEIIRRFDQAVLMLDEEGEARKKARQTAAELTCWGLETQRVRLPRGKDPGSMNQEELRRLGQWEEKEYGMGK